MSAPKPKNRSAARRRRAVPLLLLAAAAFVGGAVTAAREMPDEQRVAERFAAAWVRGDHGAMHATLAPASRRRYPLKRFVRLYRQAASTATLDSVTVAGPVRRREDLVAVPVQARTLLFGDLAGTLDLPMAEEDGTLGIVWDPHLVLPGLRRGEKLRRDVLAPPRADLEARDGTVIASGPDRVPEGAAPAGGVTGSVGPIPQVRRAEFAELGYPEDAIVGLSGLEREFEKRLAGRFGGFLRASGRVLARVEAEKGRPVRTSIDLGVQETAVSALGPRLGGIAVIRPRTGEILALAGIAYSAPQPPGSVFKIITLAGALEEKVVKPTASFPVETFTTIEGVEIENANGESCGGSLANSFAHSCNSVFAPLGARLGGEKLVAAAEAFGFNQPASLAGAALSTIPEAEEIGDDLAIGSSAIGQGVVQATPLKMVEVAGAIANRGMLVQATLLKGARGKRTRAISARTARIVDRFMRRVVTDGTGGAARIEGVTVAGKTGTAELRDTTPEPEETPSPIATPAPVDDRTDTTAWFVAYAPARRPRVAVAVMLVGEGAGGESAAPAAREVLLRALKG